MDEQILLGEEDYLDIDVQHAISSYIKVLGVGGAGTNAVNHMFKKGINGFVCVQHRCTEFEVESC